MLRFVLLLFFAIASTQTVSAAIVRIADGDCTGLTNAVSTAAQGRQATTIFLARKGVYSGCSVSMNSGNVVIEGQGAQMHSFSACILSGTNSSPTSLTLRNLTIDAAYAAGPCSVRYGDMNPVWPSYYVVLNASNDPASALTLDTVTFNGLPASTTSFNWSLIRSSGSLALRNVTAVGVSVVSPDLSSVGGADGSLLQNYGNVEIYNSTFANSGAGASLLRNHNINSRILVSSSLFAGNTSPVCDATAQTGAVQSLGGNVSTDSNCSFSTSTSDKVVPDALLNTFGDHGGLVSTLAINGGSPAKGAGIAQYCEALDARGYTRSAKGCDAGAYEYGGGSGALTANGMNGFYYDPDAGGHYVSIQRIHDNGDVAIVWNAFDSNGNQAWVYGVGQVGGKHIHATMSQNIGGVLQAGGPPIGSSVRSWGTVDIDLTSCALAQFSYQSNLDGFGSGQFSLTRLAFVSDFGCAE